MDEQFMGDFTYRDLASRTLAPEVRSQNTQYEINILWNPGQAPSASSVIYQFREFSSDQPAPSLKRFHLQWY